MCLYMRGANLGMKWLVWVLLLVACAALEIDMRANRDGKLSYRQYLSKVRNFFNVTEP